MATVLATVLANSNFISNFSNELPTGAEKQQFMSTATSILDYLFCSFSRHSCV